MKSKRKNFVFSETRNFSHVLLCAIFSVASVFRIEYKKIFLFSCLA